MDGSIDLMKYLSDDDKKKIAERVYEEECRKKFNAEITSLQDTIFTDKYVVFHRILDRYINELDLMNEDFIPYFKEMLMNHSSELLAEDSDVTLRYAISTKINKIGQEVLDENHDALKDIIREKVFKCCNEKMLIAFIADIVRSLDLNGAIKNLLRNDPKWKSDDCEV